MIYFMKNIYYKEFIAYTECLTISITLKRNR